MSIDGALRTTFRNYATLFFIVAAVTVPVHVAHAFIFRDVIAVRAVHNAIAEFDTGEEVRRVSARDLSRYRASSWLIAAAELALIPVLVGATRAVVASQDSVSVPGAWRRSATGYKMPLPRLRPRAGAVALGTAVAIAIVWLTQSIGLLVSEPVGDSVSFGPVGGTMGIARAVGAPFLLIPLALAWGRAKGDA
ncbi:MAG: hypothetical protein ACRDJV_04140 [Actinomycetota bacterium]